MSVQDQVMAPVDEADPIRLLSPEGEFQPDHRIALDLGATDVISLYRDMTLGRRIDSEAIALQRQGELGLWASMRGQEAAQVGATRATRSQDMLFPSFREHAVTWCRGVDPIALLGLFRGTTQGGWDPRDNNLNIYSIVVGAQALQACGYGMGVVRDDAVGTGDTKVDTAVMVFIGDGSLSEGETNEAFVWAAAMQLPVVFFIQNNQWAISAPFATQSRVPAAQRGSGFGIPSLRVDGNDVLACLGATRSALNVARAGGGPTIIEALTYRMNAHTTSDDAKRYRDPEEEEHWRALDPIDRVAAYLRLAGTDMDALDASLAEEAEALAVRLRAGVRALPEPGIEASFLHTYQVMPPELEHQLRVAKAHEPRTAGDVS
jgi:2-oxoisovalerate dehydrogenase E1 component alpha subunit